MSELENRIRQAKQELISSGLYKTAFDKGAHACDNMRSCCLDNSPYTNGIDFRFIEIIANGDTAVKIALSSAWVDGYNSKANKNQANKLACVNIARDDAFEEDEKNQLLLEL